MRSSSPSPSRWPSSRLRVINAWSFTSGRMVCLYTRLVQLLKKMSGGGSAHSAENRAERVYNERRLGSPQSVALQQLHEPAAQRPELVGAGGVEIPFVPRGVEDVL